MKATRFVIDPNTPKRDRVYAGEGHRLLDSPSRYQFHYRRRKGVVIYRTGKPHKLPVRRDALGFWTTVAADQWWHDELNRLEGL